MHKSTKIFFHSLISFSLMTFGALEGKADVRKISFAPAYPTGTINVMQKFTRGETCIFEAKAMGNLTVNVPPGCYVQLELNPHCIEESEKLKSMPTDGIDAIKISYMSMDENDLVVNKALAAVPLFKTPLILNCFRTDVTDAGILGFKSLSKVTRLHCFMCVLDGSFLHAVKQLQSIQTLSLPHNIIKQENLKYLQELKKLTSLNLLGTNLTDAGLKDVCKIKGLKFLTIGENQKLTAKGLESLGECTDLEALNLGYLKNCSDAIIPTLLKLTHMDNLDLRNTNVTAAGLEKLKALPITKMTLPDGLSVGERQKLQKLFPKAIFLHGKKVSEDIQVQFAPLPK